MVIAEHSSSMPDSGATPPTPRGVPVIEATGLWFSYDGRRPVLDGIDLTVASGSMTMVLGRSGSGKTTLLRVLKGLLKPRRGTVRLAAAAVNGGGTGGAIAYIPQTLGLVKSASALDNVLMGALSRTGTLRSLARAFPAQANSEAKELLTRLGIGHKAREPAWALSGGERQRVAIARALMQHPALILADEFVSQLDPITAEDILGMMRDITRTQGVSLLVTTHETDIVEQYADRVIVMAGGRIVHDAPGGVLSQGDMLNLLR